MEGGQQACAVSPHRPCQSTSPPHHPHRPKPSIPTPLSHHPNPLHHPLSQPQPTPRLTTLMPGELEDDVFHAEYACPQCGSGRDMVIRKS